MALKPAIRFRLAYLLILLPGAIVGIVYVLMFRSMGLQVQAWPFIGAAAGLGAALIIVRYYLRNHIKRPGS
jgi:hypothetical protein